MGKVAFLRRGKKGKGKEGGLGFVSCYINTMSLCVKNYQIIEKIKAERKKECSMLESFVVPLYFTSCTEQHVLHP